MADLVCYIPSYNDSELVAESLASSPDWDVVISDNASDEPHRSALLALAGPRVQVIRQEKSLGRVGNWRFCVRHFVESGRQWLKLLCAGDLHKPAAAAIFSRAIEKYPRIRFLVSDVELAWPDHTSRFSPMGCEVIVQPVHSMAATVEFGNVFFGLLAALVHRDALGDGFVFGEEVLSFCADMLFLVDIASKEPTLYLPEVTGTFMAAKRKTMQRKAGSLENMLEDTLVRLHAAAAFRQLGGSEAEHQRMLAKAQEVTYQQITSSLSKPVSKTFGV